MWAPSAPNYPFLPSYGSPQTPGPPPVQPYVIYQRDPAGRIIGVVSPGQSTVPISPSPLRLGPGGTVLPGVFLPTNPECHTEDVRKLVGNINFDEPHQQARLDTPKDLSISLLEHQKIGLTWMIKMELSRMKGGILADDMGLGKTVQSMALIVTRRPENPSQSQAEPVSPNGTSSSQTTHSTAATSKTPVSSVPSSPSSTPRPRDYYTTLIVAPLSLVYQWKREIDTKTRNNCLRVYVYHGASRERRPHILTGYDVVVTTYNLLTSESPRETPAPTEPGPLFRIKYWRIILDEAQVIKNRAAKSSIAVAKLQSRYKWCLSGTPIQNSIDELYPPVRFLGIKPYNQWDAFRRDISGPAQSANLTPRAFQRVQALLKAILLRRRKTDQIDGKPILSLPGKTVHEVKENFTTPEAEFYKSVQERSEELFQSMMDANAVMKNYANILVMILRLRQACCHPLLVLDRQHRDHLARLSLEAKSQLDRADLTSILCLLCDDISTNPVILSPCGHIYCEECVETQVNNHIEDSEPACPRCQHRFSLKQAIPVGGGGGSGGGGIQPITHYDDDGTNSTHGLSPSSFIPSSKIIRTLRIIRETRADQPTDKFVVFSQFTQMLLLVSRALAREHIPHFIFDGSVAPMEREDMVKQFYDRPDVPVMLISMKCGSVGLNLCCANHVILLDLWWNPALEDQATDRVHRIGQTKPVTVHRITIPDTIEDRILHLQADKRDIIKRAFGEGDSEKLGRLSYQDLVYLFRG
ncbi:SNF2 family N-terminal domain-containing protein [Dimargaris cristalligena]|uniref:SNF2 family N-terminal domain-containing protein n=1 Tax=Dimargaris cristalligena TaxID=215637 RepID=A0A4V1J4J9_9FUNG|nr:SNF2 family N-terminal domain-containing protein [Dimargaris cristalligena]|eukprot:RKP35819.1 SNF2 family N-terminal domain-containing protein [Dimargaris cristalligena]